MKSQVKNLELGQEYPTTDEADAIQNIIKIHVESFLKRNIQPIPSTTAVSEPNSPLQQMYQNL